jgi:hypothetical protein
LKGKPNRPPAQFAGGLFLHRHGFARRQLHNFDFYAAHANLFLKPLAGIVAAVAYCDSQNRAQPVK